MKENVIKDPSYQFALWLRLLRNSKILNTEQAQDIILESEEIVKILTSIVKTGQKNTTNN